MSSSYPCLTIARRYGGLADYGDVLTLFSTLLRYGDDSERSVQEIARGAPGRTYLPDQLEFFRASTLSYRDVPFMERELKRALDDAHQARRRLGNVVFSEVECAVYDERARRRRVEGST